MSWNFSICKSLKSGPVWASNEALLFILTSFFCSKKIPGRGGGIVGSPYIQMIGMIVYFLDVVIGDLVFFRGCSSKIL